MENNSNTIYYWLRERAKSPDDFFTYSEISDGTGLSWSEVKFAVENDPEYSRFVRRGEKGSSAEVRAIRGIFIGSTNGKIVLEWKSDYSKSDCLFCDNPAVYEALAGDGKNCSASIRCCRAQKCIEKAKRLARHSMGWDEEKEIEVEDRTLDF